MAHRTSHTSRVVAGGRRLEVAVHLDLQPLTNLSPPNYPQVLVHSPAECDFFGFLGAHGLGEGDARDGLAVGAVQDLYGGGAWVGWGGVVVGGVI